MKERHHISWNVLGYVSILSIAFGVMLCVLLTKRNYLESHEQSWADHHPKVAQPFLQHYDSLSTGGLESFIGEWRIWSEQREAYACDSLVNRICDLYHSHYSSDNTVTDPARFVVRDVLKFFIQKTVTLREEN